ncbi:hypothetical protein MKZ38_002277 [Zalerion maritima]|uniref:NAD-dependent epimerase/dehydratase domain-containing protein n=1 Tax=Zalerion maritima TaxID=339359 RepID=A0AAD5RQJ1_9PEZI|nr:hypothetical protein MKZ38_002277 [Zalerion maritima]
MGNLRQTWAFSNFTARGIDGGSGFIAWHILTKLLDEGYDVVLTVRTSAKGDAILQHLPEGKRRLVSYALVDEIAKEDAFDEVIRSHPNLTYVIHTASPVFQGAADIVASIISPAINGATGILKSVHKYGSSVSRVVLTSSTAAVVAPGASKVFTEDHWAPHTLEKALAGEGSAYSTSKVSIPSQTPLLAEKAAWDFMRKAAPPPSFTLTVINNTWTFGPIAPFVASLSSVNMSNAGVRDLVAGVFRSGLPPTAPVFTWVDVRDVATAHVLSLTNPEAPGKRFVIAAGDFSNKTVCEIVRKRCPEVEAQLPPVDGDADDIGDQTVRLGNARSRAVLGMSYLGLEESIGDTVRSLVRLVEK